MAVDQWASVRPFFPDQKPVGIGADDVDRVMAYDVYENFYWSDPNVYKIVPRSDDASPIYLPSARSMVEASHRFLAVNQDFLVHPKVGTSDDQALVKGLLQNIWKREKMYAKQTAQKRNLLIRGDMMWHITADPSKDPGERISIHVLHPGQYFPIYAEDNADRVIGCYIVDTTEDPNDKTKLCSRRQMYRKTDSGGVESELALFELGKWDDRVDPDSVTKLQDVLPLTVLPPAIKAIPVYHTTNFQNATIWGSSELRGIETVVAAVNQAVSDQDLALSLQGLGVYFTDAGPPKDANGAAAPFIMGPGEVVEVPTGATFGRVSGIQGSLPGIDHMKFVLDAASEAIGVPDIARGKVDVSVAESGVSLALQLAPLLAKNAEKEQELLAVNDHMLYDIVKQWMVAYESVTDGIPVEVASVVGDPMPQNRADAIAEILTLVTSVPPLITVGMAQAKLTELGWEFPEGSEDAVFQDAQRLSDARASADPYASRYKEEIDETGGTPSA